MTHKAHMVFKLVFVGLLQKGATQTGHGQEVSKKCVGLLQGVIVNGIW